ncbi:MAG: hypothetical protein BZY80_06290 [SAR202 cluster bacterium Io17-Chloro-G2]|nr:MAG: hypothetical protein BZY80_06290 [SAR202 cluster bacterium Io17-Chloro-G2]
MRIPLLVIQQVAVAWVLFFFAAACAGPGSTPTPTPTPLPTHSPVPQAAAHLGTVNLPDDEGIHLAPVEWWYFNGHLDGSNGNRYSFHFVTFIIVTSDGQIPQLMQLSLADHGAGLYLTDEMPALVNNLQPTKGLFTFDIEEWHMSGAVTGVESAYELVFNAGGYTLDLAAKSQSPAVLHQEEGLVDLGRAGKTYYYSRPKLDISGTLTQNGMPVQVAGKAWMDHQWGDLNTLPIGWDWASLQMDDGSELMISLVWDSSTGEPITSYGTYVPGEIVGQSTVGASSMSRHLPGDAISLTSKDAWRSPATGVEYPSGWLLEVSSLELAVNLVPIQENAEFGDSLYVPIAYWEGAVAISGTKHGDKITGKGFVELVGYDKVPPEARLP